MTYPKLTPDLKKFLSSDYGKKLLRQAKLYGQNDFKFGKEKYDINYLLGWTEALK